MVILTADLERSSMTIRQKEEEIERLRLKLQEEESSG
jgi:hypothetical protein